MTILFADIAVRSFTIWEASQGNMDTQVFRKLTGHNL